MSIIKYLRRLELKNSEVLQKEVKSSATAVTSRRDFFKKTAIYSAGALSAASVLAPISARADDPAIINMHLYQCAQFMNQKELLLQMVCFS